jgi:hypothetical protein
MDDAFVALLAIMAFAFAATIAVMLAAAVLAATMTGTTVWALGKGFGAFGTDFKTSVDERGGERRKPRAPEPAFEIYVLGQVFADYRHGLEHAAGVLGEERQKLGVYADKYKKKATMPISYGIIIGGYVGTALAGVLGAIAGLLVGIVVALAAGASWVLIWMLRAADGVRRRVRHASYECPTDHERFALPVYVCPACGAEHKRLVPGRWGILKRECECGKTALPTTVIKGRQRVPQRCPSGHSMSGFLGFAENLPIAIVGGPSAGKSTFLAGALVELEDPKAGVSIEPLSESRDAYARLVDAMRAGVPPEKTVDEQRPALVAEVQGSGRSRALYAYDLAGEVYSAEDKVRGLRFLARSAGIVLLVDPFSIRNVADDRAEELKAQAAQILPSTEDPMRVYERLLATLKEASADTQHMPIAIVIAKSDALGIDKDIAKLTESAGAGQGERKWLEDNGGGNLVRSIEQDFKEIGWFSVSALGRMPDQTNTTPFVPRGALAPLLWILARRDIDPSSDPSTATHTAQQLVGSAADFPPPSAAARKRSAAIVAIAASALLLAATIALASTAGSAPGSTAASSTPGAGSTGSPGNTEPTASTGTTGSTDTTGTTTSGSSGSKTYPLISPEHAQPVRSGPNESSSEVGKIEPNSEVSIVCTVQGESVENDTIWDKITNPAGYVTDTALNTGTHSAVASACPNAPHGSGGAQAESPPAQVLHHHLERLGNGEYQAAFELFSSAYQASAAGWVANREAGDPVIKLVHIGTPSYGNGGNTARLYVLFYAKDRNDSEGSDTHCRRFAGIAEVVKENNEWRYEPKDDSLSSTVELEGDPNCQS